MSLFTQIAHSVLQSGYLSLKTEQQLKRLCRVAFEPEDVETMLLLQQALQSGRVQRLDAATPDSIDRPHLP